MRDLLGVLLVAVCLVRAASADAPQDYPFVAFDEVVRLAREQQRMIFLYFGRYGCGYCDKTNKESFTDPRVKELYVRHYVLVYVDAESGRRLTLPSGERITERELGPRFRAFVTPVFAFMTPEGEMILKRAGVKTADDFLAYDRYVRGGRYREQSFSEFQAGGS